MAAFSTATIHFDSQAHILPQWKDYDFLIDYLFFTTVTALCTFIAINPTLFPVVHAIFLFTWQMNP